MADLTTVILAAGKGTRMKSSLPKVLHKAGGKAMLAHVLAAAKEAGAVRNIVVVGFGGETVEKALAGEADFVTQEEQLGTGHAVLQAEPLLHEETGTVLVLCGDTPLLTGKLLKKLAKVLRARFLLAHEREFVLDERMIDDVHGEICLVFLSHGMPPHS